MNSPSRRTVTVSAPARLHLGLMSYGSRNLPQFGGLGIMLDSPRMTVRVRPDPDFVVRYGKFARRVAEFARHWAMHRLSRSHPICHIDVIGSYPEHIGLGSGTQLGLALAKALDEFHQLPPATAESLAKSVDRGRRSAVGTHGFFQGGMIFESGKQESDQLGKLEQRVSLPAAWRFLLIRPESQVGASGEKERKIFEHLAAIPEQISRDLHAIATERVLPAAKKGDFQGFSAAIFDYGTLAGNCFKNWQHGTFSSPLAAEIVATIRSSGTQGVGQSSWGPTLFALLESDHQAEELRGALQKKFAEVQLETSWARADDRGFSLEVSEA